MAINRTLRAAAIAFTVIAPIAVLGAAALAQGRQPERGRSTARILKPDQIRPTMRAFTIALGVRCDFCHSGGDFQSDANPMKVKAREMLRMVEDINKRVRVVEGKVTCNMCHRGRVEPEAGGGSAAPGRRTGRERGGDDD